LIKSLSLLSLSFQERESKERKKRGVKSELKNIVFLVLKSGLHMLNLGNM